MIDRTYTFELMALSAQVTSEVERSRHLVSAPGKDTSDATALICGPSSAPHWYFQVRSTPSAAIIDRDLCRSLRQAGRLSCTRGPQGHFPSILDDTETFIYVSFIDDCVTTPARQACRRFSYCFTPPFVGRRQGMLRFANRRLRRV